MACLSPKVVCITACAGLYLPPSLSHLTVIKINFIIISVLASKLSLSCAFRPDQQDALVKSNRPVNLSMATVIELNLKSPVAIASILHRLSGILLFFVIPGLLWLLQCSLSSPEGFAQTQALLSGVVAKLVLFVALAGLVYHFLAGVKHLIADWGIGESLEGGRSFAKATLVVSAFAIAALFVWVVLS